MSEHSPNPWTLHQNEREVLSDSTRNGTIAHCLDSGLITVAECKANAAFIVRACNAHDDLLAAAEAAHTWLAEELIENNIPQGEANAVCLRLWEAISKARGQA